MPGQSGIPSPASQAPGPRAVCRWNHGATDRGIGKDARGGLTNGAGMGPQAKADDASFSIKRQANVQSAATGARARLADQRQALVPRVLRQIHGGGEHFGRVESRLRP
jgi:hypothetical protein